MHPALADAVGQLPGPVATTPSGLLDVTALLAPIGWTLAAAVLIAFATAGYLLSRRRLASREGSLDLPAAAAVDRHAVA
jgi:lysozyme family protein